MNKPRDSSQAFFMVFAVKSYETTIVHNKIKEKFKKSCEKFKKIDRFSHTFSAYTFN